MKLSKIASILELQTTPHNPINQRKYRSTTTTYSPHQLGRDFNLTIVRNCPVR